MAEKSPVKSRVAGWAFGGFFLLIWGGLTLAADAFIAYGMVRQVLAYRYATTDGTIRKSDVIISRDSDGNSYRAEIEYDYFVGDVKYHGDTYRHGPASGEDFARRAVAENPVDARVRVYYDPSAPEEAILSRGIIGADLLIITFLTPFNLVLLVGVLTAYYNVFPRPAHAETGGVRVRDDGLVVRAFVPDHSAVFLFGAILFGVSFAMILLIAFTVGTDPTLSTMLAAWALTFFIAGFFAFPRYYRELSGQADLVIDRFGHRLTLPVTYGRKASNVLTFDDIGSFSIKDECKVDSDGDATHTYHVILHSSSLSPGSHCIWVSSDHDKAKRFLTWLRTTIGVAPDVQPRKSRNAEEPANYANGRERSEAG